MEVGIRKEQIISFDEEYFEVANEISILIHVALIAAIVG